MAQMDYFRRPVLAGRNIKRLVAGTIRGSVRRKDADGTSTVPYFPGVTATQTLTIQTETGTYTATLSSTSMVQILADINTALGVNGTAFDADGVIGLRTSVVGGTGFVQVTGGTAAAAIGFDTSTGRSLRSSGGDVDSAPEGRVGNPFGTAFPGAGENITADIFQRSLARVAANLDVIYSDLVRESAALQKVPTFTLDATAGAYITLPAATRIFNGYVSGASILSRLSTVQDLAPFFAIVDATTKQLLPYKVVAVVNGVPVGAAPFLDAATTADASKNVLGLNLSKFAATSISNIREGRVVTATGVGSAASVGDVAQIASATNTTKWSNNGMKWVVDQVIDANNIVLRPASQALLTQLGVSLNDTQPVLELADDFTTGQSYGTVQIFTGSFSSGVSLVLSPPAPVTGSYELWAAQPLSLRARQSWHEQRGMAPFTQSLLPFRSGSDTISQLTAKRHSATASADIVQALSESGAALTKITSHGSILALPDGVNTTAITGSGTGTGAGVSGIGGPSGQGGSFTASAAKGSIRLVPAAAAPTTPDLGDMWVTNAGLLGINLTGTPDRVATLNGTQSFTAMQSFSSGSTTAPVRGSINLVPVTAPPTGAVNGDVWINGSVFAQIGGAKKTLAALETAQTWTATQTFGTINGTAYQQGGVTYDLSNLAPEYASLRATASAGAIEYSQQVTQSTFTDLDGATTNLATQGPSTTNMSYMLVSSFASGDFPATNGSGAQYIKVLRAGSYKVFASASLSAKVGGPAIVGFRILGGPRAALGDIGVTAMAKSGGDFDFRAMASEQIVTLNPGDLLLFQLYTDAPTVANNVGFNTLQLTVQRVG